MDLLLWRHFGREIPRAVEDAYGRNHLLARSGPILPVGSSVEVELVTTGAAPVVRVIRLWG